jgi:hypothetical protein
MCALGAPACSAFVSLDGLNDGGADAATFDASSDASDAAPLTDAAVETSVIDAHGSTPAVFRTLSTASTSTGDASVTIARPPQVQTGDLMIALVYEYQDTATTSPPDATWVPITSFHDPMPSYEVHYFERFATASDTPNFTFTTTGLQGGYASVTIIAYSGVSTMHPIELYAASTYENVTAFGSPAVTPTSANTVLMISVVGDGQSGAVWSAPANVTPRVSSGFVFVGDFVAGDAGTSSSETITCAPSTGTTANGGIAVIGLTPQ